LFDVLTGSEPAHVSEVSQCSSDEITSASAAARDGVSSK